MGLSSASRTGVVLRLLGDERHELVADKACLASAGLGNRHPSIDRGTRDFQLDAFAEDGYNLCIVCWLGAKIHID
jgi:hypothetical protein